MNLKEIKILVLFLLLFSSLKGSAQIEAFHPNIRDQLIEYRECIFTHPDSCDALFRSIVDTGLVYQDYYAIGKCKLMRGISYVYKNNIPRAIKEFMEAEEILVKIDWNVDLINNRNNLGNMYMNQGDTAVAMRYFRKALNAAKKIENTYAILSTQNQVAALYMDMGNYDTAWEELQKNQAMYDSLKRYPHSCAYYHITLSYYYINVAKHDSARTNAEIALKLYTEDNDVIGMIQGNEKLGYSYMELGNLDLALDHCKKSYHIADTAGLVVWKENSCECLYLTYEKMGNYTKAFEYHKLYKEIMDEIHNDERSEEVTRLELEKDFAKQRVQDSLTALQHEKSLKRKQKHELAQEKSKSLISYVAFGAAGIVSVLLFLGFRSKKKDNQLIMEQKSAVEQKQQEIIDSITYAKRLQDAILPSPNLVNPYLPDSFVFYSPRDGVSGDFYWFDVIGDKKNEERILFAAADCTGHGVPGAMVSVVCSNALMRATGEFDCKRPGEILDRVAIIVQETFETGHEEVRDGMDIALCSLSSDKKSLSFSGANNPVWIVRKKAYLTEDEKSNRGSLVPDDGELALIEYKGNRQPIGIQSGIKPFTTTDIPLKPDDRIYLFTDGYPDQFGGEKGKKLKHSTFKKLILSNAIKPMAEQKKLLEKTITDWKGELEQTDDICVFGVKI